MSGQEFCWVVDPNDGTADFLAGRVGSAVSVGLLRNTVPVLGVVYAPLTVDRGADCIAWAEGMSAVVRNGQPVSSRLDQCTLDAGSRVMVSTAATRKTELAVIYSNEASLALVSQRCFGGAPAACYDLAKRDWVPVFR
ncbi:inositol monophosphatase family protein [Pseudomonas sp. BN411]|uniref:inositol monophosphatase family protein n=1 Tax=Pseudomonas sp. BN411 TaxID=2567887 RepID=UPI002458F09E|nr:inositol monophosphatase family protein [Pseudomonas sp. BN411]